MISQQSNPQNNDCKFFGYKHLTTEIQPRCFYVGKGLKKRPFILRGRNKKHRHVREKYGCVVEVCVGPLSHDEIVLWETSNIKSERTYHYDDPEGIGCNFTLGGEGTPGSHHNRGKKKPPFSEEHKTAIKMARSKQDMTKHAESMRGKNKRPRPDLVERNQKRKGQKVKCSTCNTIGHNRRGCLKNAS